MFLSMTREKLPGARHMETRTELTARFNLAVNYAESA